MSREGKQQRPFYWTAPNDGDCAPTGWYQWTSRGLVYLGENVPEDGLGCGEFLESRARDLGAE